MRVGRLLEVLRHSLWLLLLLGGIGLLTGCGDSSAQQVQLSPAEIEAARGSILATRTAAHAAEALAFAKTEGLSTDFAILVDMAEHSGRNRFFVWDFAQPRVILSTPVSHGCGENPWGQDISREAPTFSNTPDSHLSSLGRYRIGARGYSNWGININYRLHGLDESNSNANRRDIVFHSWDMIPDTEVFPAGTPEGYGCPAIADAPMRQVDELLRGAGEEVLMWIYE